MNVEPTMVDAWSDIGLINSYGPNVSDPLLRDVLHPYRDMFVATKLGLTRPGRPNQRTANSHPDYLRQQALDGRGLSDRARRSGCFAAPSCGLLVRTRKQP